MEWRVIRDGTGGKPIFLKRISQRLGFELFWKFRLDIDLGVGGEKYVIFVKVGGMVIEIEGIEWLIFCTTTLRFSLYFMYFEYTKVNNSIMDFVLKST